MLVEVSIRDRGPGIKPADERRLFEPFYTTKEQGLGLGLALCSTHVAAHGGHHTLGTHPGGGAVATFALPAGQCLMAAPMMSEMSDTFTVFLVDDDHSVLRALSRLLRARGYDVQTNSTRRRAFLDSHDPAVPGCAILDVAMPGLDGLALQERLTVAAGSQRPIIFLTGKGDVPTSVRAMRAGAVDFLTKPVGDQALLDAIARAQNLDARARRDYAERSAIRTRIATLTPREREVLTHVVAGRLNKADRRRFSGTVEEDHQGPSRPHDGEAGHPHRRRPGAPGRAVRHRR